MNRCEKTGCIRQPAEDSEYCVRHKTRPYEKLLDNDKPEKKKFEVTFHISGEETVELEAYNKEEAKEQAQDLRKNDLDSIIDIHTDVREIKDNDSSLKTGRRNKFYDR